MVEIARQILAAALADGHFEVVWWGCAAIAGLFVWLVAAGVSGSRNRRARRSERKAGLTRREARVLRHLSRAGHLRQDAELFRNRALLDGILQRGTANLRHAGSLDRSRYRHRLAVLLTIKARVDAAFPATVRSLSPFQEGERITLARATTPVVESRLLAGIGDDLACAVPAEQEAALPLRAGMQVTVRPVATTAATDSGILATVLGRGWVAGQPALLVTRRTTLFGTVRPRGGRRHCELTPLAVDRPRPDEPAVAGTLVSLDAQWAGVRAVAPVAAGRLVKLVVELGKAARLPLYGKVVQSPRRRAAGLMLVHLTGLSRSRISDLYRFVDECWPRGGVGGRC